MIQPQWFVPKKRLLKVLQDRVRETKQYVNIDRSVSEADRNLLEGYHESLARFAQRHNIAVNFTKPKESNITMVNVYRTSLSSRAIQRRGQGLWYYATPEYRATEPLPQQNNVSDYGQVLKDMISKLSASENTSETEIRFPHWIKHENKYYDWERGK